MMRERLPETETSADRTHDGDASLIAAASELLAALQSLQSFVAVMIGHTATIASERARAEAAEAEVFKMRAENEKLREALTPFAEMASDYDPEEGDDADLAWFEHPKVGDLRRARAALESKE